MTKRIPIVAANWKMHPMPAGWDAPESPFRTKSDTDVAVFPAASDIDVCVKADLVTGAQYGRPENEGAFTGDLSMRMVANHGCRYVLCGHSERRQHHHESDEFIAEQVVAAIEVGIIPVLCIGETADERELGNAQEVVKRQLMSVLEKFSIFNFQFSIAYEPVWAIGTGKTASAEDAQEMHAFIRSLLPDESQQSMRIIYGGSVKPDNAAELIAQEDIDGFLVGGASLKPQEFAQIVDSIGVKA